MKIAMVRAELTSTYITAVDTHPRLHSPCC